LTNIIIDTDIGDDIDDALAVAFAVRRPELSIKAITTVFRRTDLRAAILAKLLSVLGADDIPIAPGLRLPIRGVPDDVRRRLEEGEPNQYAFVKPDDDIRPFTSDDAVGLIIDTVNKFENDITVVTIGAISNLAAAIEKEPAIVKKVNQIAIMGGAPFANRVEHNIKCDPDAAKVVFNCGAKIFLGAFEPTCQIIMTPAHIERLKACRTPLSGALVELIECWWPRRGPKVGPVLYDVAPILWCFEKKFFKTQPMRVDVETEGTLTRGYTVPVRGEPNMEVCSELDAKGILELFMDTICG